METNELLYQLGVWKIGLGLLVAFVLATEIGFRRGRMVGDGLTDAAKSELSTLQGAMMGLLALLLGFSFALAESRFEARRALVVQESNAIGSTYLRSRMLTEPSRSAVERLLREYVDTRLEYYEVSTSPERLRAALAKSEGLQKDLWSQALQAAAKNPNPVQTGMFVTSLNEMIDVFSERDAARLNHVPESVLWLLSFVATVTMALVGHGNGVGNRRNLMHTTIVTLILTFVIMAVMDLDRPRRGVIRVSQQSMVKLQESLR